MVMLSKLARRFSLVDDEGRRAKLFDLAVAHLDGDYPPVTRLFFRKDKNLAALPWDAVNSIDWQAEEFRIKNLEAAQIAFPEQLKEEALLRRDIHDALVIDLQNRRVTRANDLCLEEDEGQLLLRSADTSARAILRRLSRGWFATAPDDSLYDWKYVEFLRGEPRAVKSGAGEHLRIARLPPGEIALLSAAVPYLHAAELLTLLPDSVAADTIEAMPPERQLQVFEELSEEQALDLLKVMAPDVAADIVGRLETKTARHYLESLPKKQSERVIELLRYPEDTVGGIMTNDVIFVPRHLTVGEARERLRERLKEPEFVYLIYVVEDEETRELCGLIALRNLITEEDDKPLEEVMDPYVTTLHPFDPANEASYRVLNSNLAAMPVVGNRGQLLGVVTVDAAVAQVAPPSWSAQAPRIFS